MYDWLIIGAGLTGATLAERLATELDQKVLVVERRNHIGGNAYDERDEHGVLVHRYGPHIFHTNARRIRDYLSRFTGWTPVQHQVEGVVEGHAVPIPFNLVSIERLFSERMAARMESALLEHFPYGQRAPIGKLRETGDDDLVFLADYVHDRVFEGYNRKQWGVAPDELLGDPAQRVPVKVSRSNRYYEDSFEAMPAQGYTAMFRRMLTHPNIHTMLNTDYRDVIDVIPFDKMIYSGAIDAFFDHVHGPLLYRSLDFEFIYDETGGGLGNGQTNYPEEYDFLRATDFKRLVPQHAAGTTILREYPVPYERGCNEPFYFVPTAEQREIHRKYAEEARLLGDTVHFAGWLTSFQYYNMDQAVGRALTIFQRIADETSQRPRPSAVTLSAVPVARAS